MHSNSSNRAARAWGFMALWGVVAMGLGLAAFPAEAAPFAYVTGGDVSVIDTATNGVVATVQVRNFIFGVAVAPDGKHVYIILDTNVSVIDTVSNTVVATVPVGGGLSGVAVAPDGKHVYVTQQFPNTVSVIDTASNTVVGTPIPVGGRPIGVAVTPNGKHAYVGNTRGTFSITIPPGSFKKHEREDEDEHEDGLFTFRGVIGGVSLQALIAPTGTLRYAFLAAAERASLTGTTNPVPVTLTIGDDSGATAVRARIR